MNTHTCYSGDGEAFTCFKVWCPACNRPNDMSVETWDRSINLPSDSTYRVTRMDIICDHCHGEIDARIWHRAYEQQEFARLGVVTPRMLKQDEPGSADLYMEPRT